MEYNLVICGGTFDRLHAGHKAFLRYAFEKGEQVVIGLTSERYVKEIKKNNDILSFAQREEDLTTFLKEENLFSRAKIVAIDSSFDQTDIPESDHVALVVSEETYQSGLSINREREEKGLSPFQLLVFPMQKDTEGKKISSTSIREGRITRDGVLLPDRSFLSRTLHVPVSLRESLHKPFGMLFTKDIPKQFLRNSQKIVTVGDVTTKRLHQLGVSPKIAVIDFFVERKKTNESLTQIGFSGKEKIIHIINPSGQLVPGLWKKLLHINQSRDSKNVVIIVDGEEDLLVVPLILILPLGDIIMYGQPNFGDPTQKKGIVILEITEALKEQTYRLLEQFVRK